MVAGGQVPSFGGSRFESDRLVWVYSRCVFRLRNTCNPLRSYAERLRVLDSHQGFVKGVCWDPVGEFLATGSDDRSVRIWRTSDWELEAEVKKPFDHSPGTFFRRQGRCPGELLWPTHNRRKWWRSKVKMQGQGADSSNFWSRARGKIEAGKLEVDSNYTQRSRNYT